VIAALYVQKKGVYYGLPDVDPWDAERDARLYAGPWPVVAHPPCQRWSQLAHIHKSKPGLEIGADGGCFLAALNSVRRWGGILEHPKGTAAWEHFCLPRPTRSWTRDLHGGWVTEVEQGNYGHRAQKATWLYAFGIDPPRLDWTSRPGRIRVDFMSGNGPERSRTPLPFRDLLLSIARTARKEAA
jgi:hypothetical protein